ncbi:LOW QUALITY PROTEIN: uncharacterized protein LOC119576760 [Penaeus monodon]|uniref:LOW QUALITY PROTEIN: uncharacterized protein LOC119576760 n=1 Tax=Penaeus monodon TaxID=6687 RepID=UPI0018A7BB9F|nr:LOW QUALITY PROTEIN: uncharacterized protein LOC119576760 [Penaeus monodon]
MRQQAAKKTFHNPYTKHRNPHVRKKSNNQTGSSPEQHLHPISSPPPVPPDIIDRESSGDLTVREGQDVNLTCRAKGHPTPNIVWRREDNQKIVLDAEKTVPPVAWVPQQLEGAYIGQELTIECHTEAFPKSINYWTNTKGRHFRGMRGEPRGRAAGSWVASDRFDPIVTEGTYKVYMELRIRRVEAEDYGTFKCIAKNSLGETDGAIKVYQIETPKAHSNSVSSSEEPEGASGESPPPTSTRHLGKDHKKYESYPHPKGVNDISDEHRRAKSQVGKGSGHLNTLHRGRQPGYPVRPDQDSGARASTPHTVTLLLLPLFALAFCPPFRLPSLPSWLALRL